MENKTIRMLRVANIIEDARVGGPQIRMIKVAKRLKGTMYETTIVLPKEDNAQFKQMLIEENIKFKELPLHRLTKEKKHLIKFVFFFFYELYILYSYLKKEKFDIVHVSGGSWQWKGVIAGKLAGCKTIWHLNDTQMSIYIRFVFKMLSKHADAYIVAGTRVKKYYLETMQIDSSDTPIEIIQAPVDFKKFDVLSVEKAEDIQQGKVKIYMTANINPIKGIEDFLAMVNYLNKKYKNDFLHFYIAGNIFNSQKKYYNTLLSYIKKHMISNVTFLGPRKDIPSVLKAVDIYVCSSIAEASPTSVWEAMAMKKPVVSTDVGDVGLFINKVDKQFVCKVGKPECLSERVSALIDDEKKRIEYGENLYIVAKQHLSLEKVVQLHKCIYEKVFQI